MPVITFIEHDGKKHHIDATAGSTILRVALDNSIQGILGDCGGCCSCATCHCYIESEWSEVISPPSDDEAMLIEGALHVTPESRLACQITVLPEMEGMVVRLPESQM